MITNEELNDQDLWIRVTNSTDHDNVFFFKADQIRVVVV